MARQYSIDMCPHSVGDEVLALELQLEELRCREATKKGKYPSSAPPDLEVAYSSQSGLMEERLLFLKDLKLAHSIAEAVDCDAEIIAALNAAEIQAHEDRKMAIQLNVEDVDSETPDAPSRHTQTIFQEMQEDNLASRLNDLLITNDDLYEEPSCDAGPSIPYAQRQAHLLEMLSNKGSQCTACAEYFRLTDVKELRCRHQYCVPCLKQFIMIGVTTHDLALIPPRCCGESLPHSLIEEVLNADELADFELAQIEKATMDKTYCVNNDCGRFVPPDSIIDGHAVCPKCNAITCALCKSGAHVETDCPSDSNTQEVLQLGAQNQWQRCYSCRNLVALDTGCNHMTCRCGAEFCYLCGTKWQECRCPLWIEANLTQRAVEVVDRAPEAIWMLPRERQQRIQEVENNLRDNDDCEHRGRRKFERVEGYGSTRFECEMCSKRHRKFIMRCRRCHIDICMDCRLHRV